MGAGTSIVGAYASYFFDGSTGGCIVTLQTLLFVIALVFDPSTGCGPLAPSARPRHVNQHELYRS
jgi:manganese/iron transport system permease protein